MKKFIYILLPLFLFIFLACTGEDEEKQTLQIGDNETRQVDKGDDYITHVPKTEFEIGLRDIIDGDFKEYIGYSEVVTEASRSEAWGYKLNSTMSIDDWLALGNILDNNSITYVTHGNDESITFERILVQNSGSIESVNEFIGIVEIDDETYYWIGDEKDGIFWVYKTSL